MSQAGRWAGALGIALWLWSCADSPNVPVPTPTPTPADPGNYWVSLRPMNEPRHEVGAAAIGTKVYVLAGLTAIADVVGTLEIYDIATDTWSFGAPMPKGAHHVTAAAYNGKLYTFGGTPKDAGIGVDGVLSDVYEYDPQTNSWRNRAPMPTARAAADAQVHNG